MTEKDILRIAINLEKKEAKQFEAIMEYLGVRTRTEVLRWLIKYYYDTLIVKKIIEKE